jgi:hypothetical protein
MTISFTSIAEAAGIPEKYQGVWGISTCELPKSEDEIGEFPFLIISAVGIRAHESSCEIHTVKQGKKPAGDTLTLKCVGEGEEWTSVELWSLGTRTVGIHAFSLSEITLTMQADEQKSVYKKCALMAKSRGQ